MCVNRKLQYSLVYLVWAEMHAINKQTKRPTKENGVKREGGGGGTVSLQAYFLCGDVNYLFISAIQAAKSASDALLPCCAHPT